MVIQAFLAMYSVFWIALLFSTYLHGGVPPRGAVTFQLLVYLPLSFAGWIQSWSLLTALPSKRAVSFHPGAPSPPSALQRLVESQLLLRVLSGGIPTLSIMSVTPTAVLAGLAQRRVYAGWGDVATASADEVAEAMARVDEDGEQFLLWVRWTCVAYVWWMVLQLLMYIPVAISVLKVVTKQIGHLKRSVANSVLLHDLSSVTSFVALPPATHLPDSCKFVRTLAAGPVIRTHKSGSDTISDARRVGEEARVKLAKVVVTRRIIVAQMCATLSTSVGFLGLANFGSADGFFRVSADLNRAVNVFVPAYAFIIPILPCSILFVLLSRRPLAPPRPSSTPMTECITEWEPPTALTLQHADQTAPTTDETVNKPSRRIGSRTGRPGTGGRVDRKGKKCGGRVVSFVAVDVDPGGVGRDAKRGGGEKEEKRVEG